jgi:hypothetical protein
MILTIEINPSDPRPTVDHRTAREDARIERLNVVHDKLSAFSNLRR